MNLQKTKKQAVLELIEKTNNRKHVSKKSIREVSKKYGLKGGQVRNAYRNLLNFGVIDCRKKRFTVTKSKKTAQINEIITAKITNKTKEKIKKLKSIKFRKFTSEEFGNLLHKYIFDYKGRRTDFLIENNISSVQWYKIIKDFAITGKLLGHKVLDFQKYGKIDVRALIAFSHIYNNSRISTVLGMKRLKKYKDIYKSEASKLQYMRAMHILDLYL